MEYIINDKQIKIGGILSYLQMGLYIVIGLLYMPLMIRLLGQREYGLYNTVVSTVSMLTVLNLGFSNGYIRYFAKYKAVNNKDAIKKLNGLFLIIFSVIGMIAFACGLFLVEHLNLVFDRGLSEQEYGLARLLMLIMTFSLAISFPLSVFSIIINAHERFIFLKIAEICKTIFNPVISIPLLLLGYGSIGVVCVMVGISLVIDCIYMYYVLAKLNNQFAFRGFEKGIFQGVLVYTSFIAINLIVDQVNWNIDKILLGRFQGTLVVAIYSVGAMMQTYYLMLSTAVSNLFVPRIHNIINTCSNVQERDIIISELFIRVGRIQYLILSLIVTGFVFFGKKFIYYWVGEVYVESYYVALLFLIPVTVPFIQNLGIEIQRAEDKHKFRSIVYMIMAVINFILSIYLSKNYGATGAALGTAVSLIVANGVIMNIYYQKNCGIDICLFWKNIARMSMGLVIPIVVGCILISTLDFKDFKELFLCIFFYAVVYIVSMWFLGMNDYERCCAKDIVRKVKRETDDSDR